MFQLVQGIVISYLLHNTGKKAWPRLYFIPFPSIFIHHLPITFLLLIYNAHNILNFMADFFFTNYSLFERHWLSTVFWRTSGPLDVTLAILLQQTHHLNIVATRFSNHGFKEFRKPLLLVPILFFIYEYNFYSDFATSTLLATKTGI